MTAGTDPETVRAHVNRINPWQTASEHQYPGPYRAFLHEWCRYPQDGDLGYRIEVRGNTFVQTGGDTGTVTGAFFGPAHEGMGGVIVRDDLSAGFGTIR